MKKFFLALFVFLSVMVFAEKPYTGNTEFELTANNDGTIEYDGTFALTKGPVSASIEEDIVTDNGIVSADYPEFVLAYNVKGFTFEGTLANYAEANIGYTYNLSDVFSVNPSAYYNHVIIPDVADDGTYGFAFVASKGNKYLAPVDFSIELDGDYAVDWTYVLCIDASYKIGTEVYFAPYVGTDLDLTNNEKELDAGIKFSFIEGIVFDANWVFDENTYSLSTTFSY